MRSFIVRAFEEHDRERVVELWHRADLVRSWNDPRRDIDRKLSVDDGMFLVAAVDGTAVGTVMAGYDGHRGWINYLAVDPECREAGIGRTLMQHAEQALDDLGCPKVNLQIRTDNLAAREFYRRLGYLSDEVVSMGKRLVTDEPVE
ncbi:MAG: GNAT family acetyltransferase [Actinomycetota bacterium]